jgi:hypothetical protein
MKNFRCLATDLTVQPLLDVLDTHAGAWWEELTLRQSYPGSAHHATQSIILNGTVEKQDLQGIFDDRRTEPYPHMKECAEALTPILATVIKAACRFERFGRIIVARLPAHSVVESHIDTGKYAETFLRLHVPLRTNMRCYMKAGEERAHFSKGELWWFNHRILHDAENWGETPRIHLIVDVKGEV